MPASKGDLPVENPASLVRSRIKEKRVFEARFLYRQLAAEIGDREKSALGQELTGLLAQVEKLEQQARQQLALGRSDLAERLYLDIEQIAIDVPGVSEARKQLQGAGAIIKKAAGKKPEAPKQQPEAPKAEIAAPAAVPPLPEKKIDKKVLAARLRQGLQQVPRLWLVAIGLCGLAVLLLVLRGTWHQPVSSTALPPVSAPSRQTISIRPLEAAPSAGIEQPPPEAHPAAPAEGTAPPPPPVLKLEDLQLQESPRP